MSAVLVKKGRRAQATLEYVVLFVMLSAALFAMIKYVTRSVQAKYRQGTDTFGEGEQYEKGVTTSVSY